MPTDFPTTPPATPLRIALFAGVAAAAGARQVLLPWDAGTVAELRAAIARHTPAAAALLARSAVALNGRYARDDETVRAGDDVAIIPPVSGG